MNRHAKGSARRLLIASALTLVSLCMVTIALAQSSEHEYDFDINPLPLTQAVILFAKQTELQVLYSPKDEEEENVAAGQVKGRYTAAEALAALLPSRFTFVWINSRTITVLPPSANSPPGGVNEAAAAKDQPRSELSKDQQLSMANGGGKSGSNRGPYAFEGKMLVEAAQIFDDLDLDIPTTLIDRQEIDDSGVATLADLMSYVTQQPYGTSESLLGDGTQVANLRGLGFDSTLVLINGHRTIATASALSVNAFDLNSIPLAAVERVEVISDSMSALHGADAIGGVLNIVLRDDIPEPRLDVDYGAAAGGGAERHAAFSASGSAGPARGSIVLDYFDRGPLLGRERDRWNNQDFSRFGSADWRSSSTAPGNVRSGTSENLPGLPASFAAIPASGPGESLTPSDFVPTAGLRNLDSPYKYQSVVYTRTRKGLAAHGEYALAPETSVYGELLYVDRDSATQAAPPEIFNALVPRANPYNPFDTDVVVDVLLTDLGPRTSTHSSRMTRLAGGARGRIQDWNWEVSLQDSRDQDVSVRANDLDPIRVAAALSASETDEALNVFGGSGANSDQLLTSLLAKPKRYDSGTEALQATTYLRGPLIALPTGRVDLVVGGEWREERVRYVVPSPVQDLSGSHQRIVNAGFGELRIPVIDPAAMTPGLDELSLVLAGRLDDYSDSGDSFNPEYAVVWRPASGMGVRLSWSQSFRPPPLFDLYLPRLDLAFPIVDPARNGELALPIWRAGGNSNLQPSSAESFATTFSFAPASVSGLRIEAGYWRIHVDRTIGIPSPALLLSSEGRFADRIVRGQPSAEDIAAGLPGPLQLIDVTRLNFGSIRTSGLDLHANFSIHTRLGRFAPELSATWLHDFTTSDLVSGAGVNRLGVADAQGSIVRWRGVASLKWSRGPLGMTSAVRYIPSYEDVDVLGGRSGSSVDPLTLVDLQLSLDLGDMALPGSVWSDFEIRVGALNLFDAQPPFAEVGFLAGYDASQSDLRQRFWYLKLAKKF